MSCTDTIPEAEGGREMFIIHVTFNLPANDLKLL